MALHRWKQRLAFYKMALHGWKQRLALYKMALRRILLAVCLSECSMRHVKAATGSFRNILFSEVSGLQLGTSPEAVVLQLRVPMLPSNLRTSIII